MTPACSEVCPTGKIIRNKRIKGPKAENTEDNGSFGRKWETASGRKKKKKGLRVDMSGSGNPVKNSAKVGVGGSSEELSLIEEEPRR